MELVRKILIALEEHENAFRPIPLSIEGIDGYTKEQVKYHLKLMHQAGLIEAMKLSSFGGEEWVVKSLTWQGHEFLDAAKNDTIWNSVKTKLKEQGANIPFDVLKELLKQAAKKYFMGQ